MKVRLAGDGDTPVPLCPPTVMVTSAGGWVFSRTVYLSLAPSSISSADFDMATPGVSLSVTVTATLTAGAPVNSWALPAATAWARVTESLVESWSSAALTCTVRAVFQLAVVKLMLEGLTDTSVPLCPVILTVTPAVGLADSFTV